VAVTRTRKGGPRAAGALVPALTRTAFAARGLHEAAVITDWPAIVGEALARYSAPERLKGDGTLVVRVAGGAAALELQHLAPVVLARIATYFGFRAALRLALRQGPLPPRPAPPTAPRAGDVPLAEPARSAVDEVAEPGLRAALARLGGALAAESRAREEGDGGG